MNHQNPSVESLEAELFAFKGQQRAEFARLVEAAGDRVVRFGGEGGCGEAGCGCSPASGCGRGEGAARKKCSGGAGAGGARPPAARRPASRGGPSRRIRPTGKGPGQVDAAEAVPVSLAADACYLACTALVPPPFKPLCEDFCEEITSSETTDNCYTDCLRVMPFGIGFLVCADLCDGSEAIENEVIPFGEAEPEEPDVPKLNLEDCLRLTVTVLPADTLAAEFSGGWDLGGDHCTTDSLLVDEVAPPLFGVYSPGYDAANTFFEYVWLSAPAELVALWPESAWAFDDPICSWLYLMVGVDTRYPEACYNDPNIPTAVDMAWEPTFLVSGQQPYAAWQLIAADSGPNGDAEKVGIRLRYWVGLMHHFSMFLPLENRDRYSIEDLPPVLFDGDRVPFRGALVKWWMYYLHSIRVAIRWTDAEQGVTDSSIYYHCDPKRNVDAGSGKTYDGVTYEADTNGAPSALCFSSHAAFEEGDEEMTSLLGHVVWGEVRMLVDPGELRDLEALAQEGFARLFGERVKIQFEVNFWGRDGLSFEPGYRPHIVERNFCLAARALEERSSLHRRIDQVRQSPHGRWLFRNFDQERMKASADAAVATAKPCPCTLEVVSPFGPPAGSGASRFSSVTVARPGGPIKTPCRCS